jgi:hypothetical protein
MPPISIYVPDRYSRPKRKEQILELLRQWQRRGIRTKATKHHIAKALEIRASSYLLDLLWEMNDEGLLQVDWSTHWNGWPKAEFSLPAD